MSDKSPQNSGQAQPETDVQERDRREREELALRAGSVFSPAAPIDQRNLFAGRVDQLRDIMDAVSTRGQHVVVFGERGVGKTSLVNVLRWVLDQLPTPPAVIVRVNSHGADTFESLWVRAFREVQFQVEIPQVGFDAAPLVEIASLAQRLPPSFGPDTIVAHLRRLGVRAVFIFDEYDQVRDPRVANAFAQCIKALSDFAVDTTVILVGVGDSVDQLVAAHASVDRALVQIRMPRMTRAELAEIIIKATAGLGMTCDPLARSTIVRLAQGLPHYVHLLGLYATRDALVYLGRRHLGMASVHAGIGQGVKKAQQTLIDSYHRATSSPQKDSLFKPVLLACALSKHDDLGYFTPSAVRQPLEIVTGRKVAIPQYAHHLNQFLQAERGSVLTRTGQERRWRYRFRDPLLQPFVVLEGIAKRTISTEQVERLWGSDITNINDD